MPILIFILYGHAGKTCKANYFSFLCEKLSKKSSKCSWEYPLFLYSSQLCRKHTDYIAALTHTCICKQQ